MTTVEVHRQARTLGARAGRSSRLWWVGGLVTMAAVVACLHASLTGSHIDLSVYEGAADRWLSGSDPYAGRPYELPFTYPPFAVVLSVLVTQAPYAALVVLALTTVGAAGGGAAAAAGTALASMASTRRMLAAVVLVSVAVASLPVLRGLELGQVNGLVVGLVLVDFLLVPTRWRGWLTGVAVGIKLTPLVFLLYPLVRREWPTVARALLGFGATVVVGLVALPAASVTFWTRLVTEPQRVGTIAFIDNQGLLGVAARLAPGQAMWLWVTGSLVVLALGLVAIIRLRHARAIESVVACALVGLLVSPISWSHHWVLLPTAAVVCWVSGHPVIGATGLAVALAAPHWRLGDLATSPGLLGALVGNSMALTGLACLAALALGPPSHRRVP